jgi:tetratricopeptide (TPR) repeat protein
VLRAQSKHDEAEKALREALAMRRQLLPADHLEAAQSLFNLSLELSARGNYEEAVQLQREALAMRRRLLPADHPDVAEALAKLGKTLGQNKNYSEAETDLRDALAMQRKLFSGKHRDLANTIQSLADVLRDQNKLSEAESCYREALAMLEGVYGSDFQDSSGLYTRLLTVLQAQGKYTEAVELARAALATHKNRAGDENVGVSLDALAQALSQAGKPAEAEDVLREAIAMHKKLGDDRRTADALGRLGNLLWRGTNITEVEAVYREALALRRKLFGNEHLAVANALANVAIALNRQGKYAEADALARESIGVLKKLPGDQGRAISRSMGILSMALLGQGRLPELVDAFREIIVMREKSNLPPNVPVLNSYAWLLATCPESKLRDGLSAVKFAEKAIASGERTNANYLETLAAAYAEVGRFTNAVSTQLEAIALSKNKPEKTKYESELKLYASNLPYRDEGLLIDQTQGQLDEGKFAEAEVFARECLTLCERQIPETWTAFNARSLLGRSLLGQKKYDAAEPLLIAGYDGMKQREDEIPDGNEAFMKETLQQLVRLYEATDRAEKAVEWNRKLAEFDKAEIEKKAADL